MQKDWLIQQIEILESKGQEYEVKALLVELKGVVEEQYKRIEQAEAEIDGNLWSPRKW